MTLLKRVAIHMRGIAWMEHDYINLTTIRIALAFIQMTHLKYNAGGLRDKADFKSSNM